MLMGSRAIRWASAAQHLDASDRLGASTRALVVPCRRCTQEAAEQMDSNFMQGVQIITAFATLVMAFAAGATALFSRRLAEENRLLRRATTEPEVIAYLLPDTT